MIRREMGNIDTGHRVVGQQTHDTSGSHLRQGALQAQRWHRTSMAPSVDKIWLAIVYL
jgi:hypothetical protein